MFIESELVTRLLGQNPGKFTLSGTNSYIIGDETNRILIDTSDNIKYITILERAVHELQIFIEKVLITHHHNDHCGCVLDVVGENTSIYKGLYQDSSFFPVNSLQTELIKASENWDSLKDGQIINIGKVSLKAIKTPGHSKDHYCFYFLNEKSLFSGDLILGEGTTTVECLSSYMDSLEKVLNEFSKDGIDQYSCLNGYGRIYPGHGPVIENGPLKIQEYLNHRKQRERDVINAFNIIQSRVCTSSAFRNLLVYFNFVDPLGPDENGYISVSQINSVDIVYNGYSLVLKMAARKNVIAHLEKLQLEDRVEISQEKYWMEWFMEVVGKGFRRHLNYEIFSHFTPNSYWRLK